MVADDEPVAGDDGVPDEAKDDGEVADEADGTIPSDADVTDEPGESDEAIPDDVAGDADLYDAPPAQDDIVIAIPDEDTPDLSDGDELIPDEEILVPDLDGPCDDGFACTIDIETGDGGCMNLPRHYLCGAGELCSAHDGCRSADNWFCKHCPKGSASCAYPTDVCARIFAEPVCLLPCFSNAECPFGYSCNDLYDDNDIFLGRGCTPNNFVCCLNFDADNAGIGHMCGLHDCDETNNLIHPGATESCNDRDDDCDDLVDEGNPGGGEACQSALPGICRQGITTCVGGNIACVPIIAPATQPEECNNLDDDCDDEIDEDFKNPLTGRYESDTACGNCLTDCTVIYDRPHAHGECNATVEPTCVMRCETIADGGAVDAFDLNRVPQDGCELILDPDAVYVSVQNGDDLDPDCGVAPLGTLPDAVPCATIAKGLSRSQELGRSKVFVADGLYAETVSIMSAVSVLGGYRADTWERHLDSTMTILRGTDTDPTHVPHKAAMVVVVPPAGALIEGFIIYGENNTNSGGNSYGIFATGSTGVLTIREVTLYAGNGGPGLNGSMGQNGTPGTVGTGRPPTGEGYDTFVGDGMPCANPERFYENGGRLSCDGQEVSGGDGGGTRCPPAGGSEYSATDGNWGSGAASGAGGDAGDDGGIYTAGLCTLPPAPMTGADGSNGGDGLSGNGGAGCDMAAGVITGYHWNGLSGVPGTIGTHGSGGGGGGAGGGGDSSVEGTNDRVGGVGGGGGSGACGGTEGGGGAAGGGSFGIFVLSGMAPIVTDTTINMGLGGNGGNGGNGGSGGPGGSGGSGGICLDNCWCYQRGGKGGEGGNGGQGGGGGGGCGGAS
ncbi:MAG TPA: MopE-related protein, partial [bacterium]|nr:MopE-related protein [bacterium]